MEKEIGRGAGNHAGHTERAKAAAGSGACRAEGGARVAIPAAATTSRPKEKIWYTLTRCNCCQANGVFGVYRCASGVLVNDFFEDRMWIRDDGPRGRGV